MHGWMQHSGIMMIMVKVRMKVERMITIIMAWEKQDFD
jgi:hypothetical protein